MQAFTVAKDLLLVFILQHLNFSIKVLLNGDLLPLLNLHFQGCTFIPELTSSVIKVLGNQEWVGVL